MDISQDYPNLSGLELLRAMMAAGRRPPIMETLDFELVEIQEGRAVFAGTPGPKHYNPIGSVHGGYAATLLDSACGCAVHSCLSATQAYTTLELKIAYHRGMSGDTGRVRAEGVVLSIGKRAAFAEGKLYDAQRKLLASATSTLMVFDKRKEK